jgi:hypothetical protein
LADFLGALCITGFGPSAVERDKYDRREDPNDRNHDEELDEGKPATTSRVHTKSIARHAFVVVG